MYNVFIVLNILFFAYGLFATIKISGLKGNYYQLFIKSLKEIEKNVYLVVDENERIVDISDSLLADIDMKKDKVKKIKQKTNLYYEKSKEIWKERLQDGSDLSSEEKSNIDGNLAIVTDILKENKMDILNYDEIKRIQDPEPIIIIPEN